MDNRNNVNNEEDKENKKGYDKCFKSKANKDNQSIGLDRFSYADFILLS